MKPSPDIEIVTLPAIPDRLVPCFFGRRFLSAREVIATGIVRNFVTLRRLMAEGRFPRPLLVGRKLRVWDTLELQKLIGELAAARAEGKKPATSEDRRHR